MILTSHLSFLLRAFLGVLAITAGAIPNLGAELAGIKQWPNFRGPGATGQAFDVDPPLDWDVHHGRNIKWKSKIPKPGMNSPIVWNDRVFLTGADESGREIYCFDNDDGNLHWTFRVGEIPGSPSDEELPHVMDDTGFAAPTMTTNGQFVAAIFATGDLVCLDFQGRRIWEINLGIPKNHYGHASSLLSNGTLLYVQYDQKEDSRLIALDFPSGKIVWETARTEISWSSPILVDNNGRSELILTNSKSADSYKPETGDKLWHIDCLGGELAPSAAFDNGTLFVANEYASASAIDISNHSSGPRVVWTWDKVLPEASSPLAAGDILIIASAYGAVSCLDQKIGKVLWEHDFDVGFYSSPILAKERIYLADLDGGVQVFKQADQFELLAESKMGEDVYATPAFVKDQIYIRGIEHLFCIAKPHVNVEIPTR